MHYSNFYFSRNLFLSSYLLETLNFMSLIPNVKIYLTSPIRSDSFTVNHYWIYSTKELNQYDNIPLSQKYHLPCLFRSHTNYIRSLLVSPVTPVLLLSSSSLVSPFPEYKTRSIPFILPEYGSNFPTRLPLKHV